MVGSTLKWRETSSGVAVHGESIEFFAGTWFNETCKYFGL